MRFLTLLAFVLPLSTLAAPSWVKRQARGETNDLGAQGIKLTESLQNMLSALDEISESVKPTPGEDPHNLGGLLGAPRGSVMQAQALGKTIIDAKGAPADKEYVVALNGVEYTNS